MENILAANRALPSNYCSQPMGSIEQKSEVETIACNIMRMLKRTGDTFREFTFEEYEKIRLADGAIDWHVKNEKHYFEVAITYCESPEKADEFCSNWYEEK